MGGLLTVAIVWATSLTMAHAAIPISQPAALMVRVARVTVDAWNAEAVAAAIARANVAERREDLPDDLNPWMIDPAKATALLAALAALPSPGFSQLHGHALYLDAPDLPIMMTSPTTPASFAGLMGIEVAEFQGEIALVRLRMPLDCAIALTQLAKARTAMAAIATEVARLEKQRSTASGDAETKALHDLSAARSRRFAIASAWHENAAAASGCAPGDARAMDEMNAAQKARSDFAVPTGSLE